jgi:membrane protein DedA with SNARE-associated domain
MAEGGKLGAVIGTPFGPIGTAIGTVVGGFLGSAIGGAVGYFGGATLTDWMLQTLAPKFYYGMKIDEIDRAEEHFRKEIDRLTNLSPGIAVLAPP